LVADLVDVADVMKELRERGGGRANLILPGTISRARMAEYRRLRDSKFYLVRNRGGEHGERFACSNHLRGDLSKAGSYMRGVFHEYFTLMCVNMPWRGLDKALYGYARIKSDTNLEMKVLAWAPDLADDHPRSASLWKPTEPGEDLIAVALGVLEPISETKAVQLAANINGRRPPTKFIL
jgi:hypothetical protein